MKKTALRKEIVYQHITEKLTDEEIKSMEQTKISLYKTGHFRIYLKNKDNTGQLFQIPNKYKYNDIEDFFISNGYEVFERHNHKDRNIVAYLTEDDGIAVMDYKAKLGMFGMAVFPFRSEDVAMFRIKPQQGQKYE